MSDLKPASAEAVAALIDHTLLKPGATREQVMAVCREAAEWKTASVCVHPLWAAAAVAELEDSGVPVCTVIGFPHGATTPAALHAEAQQAFAVGAREFDLVIPYGAGIGGEWERVSEHVAAVRDAVGSATVKAILETSELNPDQIRQAARAALDGGADYLKTSSGFASGGATVEAVSLLREVAGTEAGVKASGGIRGLDDVLTMINAGASRIGASGTRTILAEARERFGE